MSKNFRLEWGSPAKPNIWRARELTFGQPLKIVEVLSEVMVGALEISATDVRYFRSASSWADGSTVLAQIGKVDRERFESAYFYNKYIKPHIESGKIKIKEGFKVASSEMTLGELIQARPESISLPWGSPPKPNIWKTKRVSYWGDRVRYIVQSPAIAKHNVLKNYNREILSFEIEIRQEATGFVDGEVYIKSMGGIVDKFVVARALPSSKLSFFLKEAWKNISESSIRGNYFTEGMKIASSSTHIDDLFDLSYLGKTFRLDWGSPAKPNLWKFTLKGQDRKHKILNFEIESPLIKENPKVIDGQLYNLENKLYVRVEKSDFYSTYNLWVRDARGIGSVTDNIPFRENPSSSIEGLMRVFWERFGLNIKRDLLKSGMKVASSSTHIDDLFDLSGGYLGKNFRLDWGSPAKPNLWRFTLKGQDRKNKILDFEIRSPLIKENPKVIDGKLYNLEDKLYVKVVRNDLFYGVRVANALQKEVILDNIPVGANPSSSIEGLMRVFWERFGLNIKRDLLKSGMKVASNRVASPKEYFSTQFSPMGKTFRLDWGDPPKPNLWKFTLKGSERDSLGEESYRFEISSPLIKNGSLEFTISRISSIQYELRLYSKTMDGGVKTYYHGDNKNIEHIMRGFWEKKKGQIKSYFLKPSMKVASAEVPFDDLFDLSYLGKTFRLDWGDPPKPNLWKFKLKGQDRKNIIINFEIESPLIKESPKVINGQLYNLEDKLYVRIQKGTTYYAIWVRDVLGKKDIKTTIPLETNVSGSIEGLMRLFWSYYANVIKRDLLKSGMKVASASTINSLSFKSFLEMRHVDKEISLPWGNPPKPNIWKAEAKGVHNHKIITIRSPILKDTLTLDIKVDESWGGNVVGCNIRSGYIQYLAWGVELSKYEGQTLNDFLKDIWTRKVSGDKRLIKDNMKVASSVSGSMSFLEFLYTKHTNAEISLPWGSPPKPNIWKAKVSDKTIQGVDVYKEIHISSPVLKEDLVYFFVVSDYNNKTYVVFKLFSKDSNKIIHSYTYPLADYKRYTLYDVLKKTYEYIIAPTLKENILKEGLKVASKKGSSNAI